MATADRSAGLWVWEAGTDREFYRLDGHKGAITDLAWRPDSNVLASCSEDGTVKLWNMLDGNLIRSINAHGGGVETIDFLPDGRLVSGGRDKTVKVWDAAGKAIKTFPAFPEIVLEVAASFDGRHIVAGDWSGEIRLLDIESAKTTAVLTAYPQAAAPAAPAP
ncbi:MAG: hypothetical protein D6741_19400 [Planctomycetota bacterium]|nr:MAG: hypothetical protein D6741_19400 [Planctomycetota bacterium]